MPPDKVEELIQKHVLGIQSEAEREELACYLKNDEATDARRKLRLALKVDSYLEEAALELQQDRFPEKPGPGGTGWLWKIGGAAAAILIGLFCWNYFSGRESTAEATIVAAIDAVIDGSEMTARDITLDAGSLTLDRGILEIRFARGAKAVLEGKAAFEILDGNAMHLEEGALWVHCPKEARGFRVRLPGGRDIVDLGTEFGVVVTEEGDAEVHVFEGAVSVSDPAGGIHRLDSGSALGWSNDSPPARLEAPNAERFRTVRALAEAVRNPPGETPPSSADTGDSDILMETQSSTGIPLPYEASKSDLINAGVVTLVTVDVSPSQAPFPRTGINDGEYSSSVAHNTFFQLAHSQFPATALYTLDTSANPAGYDIIRIESLMGFHGPSSQMQANQTYRIEYSVVGSPEFKTLATVVYTPFPDENGRHFESRVGVKTTSGSLASGVDQLRFVFFNPYDHVARGDGHHPGTVIREIDVFGSPTKLPQSPQNR